MNIHEHVDTVGYHGIRLIEGKRKSLERHEKIYQERKSVIDLRLNAENLRREEDRKRKRVADQLVRMEDIHKKYMEFSKQIIKYENSAVKPKDWDVWVAYVNAYMTNLQSVSYGNDNRVNTTCPLITSKRIIRKIRDTMKENVREQ